MNYVNNKTSDPHIILINLSDKASLKRSKNGLSNLSIYFTWKNIKYQLQRGMKKLNNLTDYVLYQIFKIVFGISPETWTSGRKIRLHLKLKQNLI